MERKEVNFNGAKLLAIKDQGKMYVAINLICKNLSMTKGQIMTQLQKVQRDETLKNGIKNKDVGAEHVPTSFLYVSEKIAYVTIKVEE